MTDSSFTLLSIGKLLLHCLDKIVFWQLFISGNYITNKIIWFRTSYFIFVGIKEQKWYQMNQSMDTQLVVIGAQQII